MVRGGRRPRLSPLSRPTALAIAVAFSTGGCAWLLRVSSPGSTKIESNGAVVGRPAISGDGRYVAFASNATNLVPGDTNGRTDIFVRDTTNGAISRVSVPPTGTQFTNGDSIEPFISGDGRYVAFTSSTNNNVRTDVYLRDRTNNTTTNETSNGNDSSSQGSVSDDGQTVGFVTMSNNLNTHTNGGGAPYFTIKTQSRTDCADAIVPAFDYCEQTNSGAIGATGTSWYTTHPNGSIWVGSGFANLPSGEGVLGASGVAATPSDDRVAFSTSGALVGDDTNNIADVYTAAGSNNYELDSVADDGSLANGPSFAASISADGRFVAFESDATNLVPGDKNGQRDVFVRDRVNNHTYIVSTDSQLKGTNGISESAAISADGRYVAFGSTATNLDAHDTNAVRDAFVRDSVTPVVTSVSPSSVPAGEETFVTLIGHGFLDNPPPKVNFNDPNIVVGGITVIDDSHAGGFIDVFVNAKPGAHTVLLLNAGTGPSQYAGGGAVCMGCLSVGP